MELLRRDIVQVERFACFGNRLFYCLSIKINRLQLYIYKSSRFNCPDIVAYLQGARHAASPGAQARFDLWEQRAIGDDIAHRQLAAGFEDAVRLAEDLRLIRA